MAQRRRLKDKQQKKKSSKNQQHKSSGAQSKPSNVKPGNVKRNGRYYNPKWQDGDGKFKPGNPGYKKGNPHAKAAMRFKQRVIDYFDEHEDQFDALIQSTLHEALKGSTTAQRELLNRLFGRPRKEDTREPAQIVAEGQELERQQKAYERMEELEKSESAEPAQLDLQLIHDVSVFAQMGMPLDGICDMLGIMQESIQDWFSRGNAYIRGEGEQSDFDKLCGLLVKSFRHATARYRHKLVNRSTDEGNPVSILERRDRSTFGRDEDDEAEETDTEVDERYL